MSRKLYEIAQEIKEDIAKEKNQRKFVHMRPYLNAMAQLNSISDSYGMDSAKSVVLYFLSNATVWKGEVARKVKKELREMVK